MKLFVNLLFLHALIFSCGKTKNIPTHNPTPTPLPLSFVKGADISWLTQMEASGKKFYNNAGVETDIFALLKSLGMNTIRLRVWVNPSPSWCGVADVIAKATRAKNLGMRIMINFHYSDSWADPGKQFKPAAWASQNFSTLKTSLANHTTDVLTQLKNAGIAPEWVQIGNETNDGMLWPDGKASTNMSNFAELVTAGYNASKAVFPTAKVIVHISNGHDNSLFRWIFDGLKTYNAPYDIIGMSLYPSPTNWSTFNQNCLTNMNDMVARYNKEVMIVEVGMSWDSPNVCKAFLSDLISKTAATTNNKGLGVLYWEPQSYGNWQGYSLGAFDNSGKPTIALSAFQ
jgi:arabinogalactan endo-1,4-beta-galactosidase